MSRPSLLSRARTSLAAHKNRLAANLTELRAQLRESVARTLAQTVAGVVRDAIAAVLGASPDEPPPAALQTRTTAHHASLWAEHDTPEERDDPTDLWLDQDDDLEVDDRPEVGSPAADEPVRASTSRWPLALAVGCETAAWWLRRKASQWSLSVSVGIGILSTLIAYVAGAGLTGSALSLISLADVVASAAALPGFISTP